MAVPKWGAALTAALALSTLATIQAFTAPVRHSSEPRTLVLAAAAHREESTPSVEGRPTSDDEPRSINPHDRRAFLSAVAGSASSAALFPVAARPAIAEERSEGFESIAARAARVSQEVAEAELAKSAEEEEESRRRRELAQKIKDDPRTIYDFTLPVNGKAREVAELVGQTFSGGDDGNGWSDAQEENVNAAEGRLGCTVKAILVVNIKQDDPIARKNIPELIALASK